MQRLTSSIPLRVAINRLATGWTATRPCRMGGTGASPAGKYSSRADKKGEERTHIGCGCAARAKVFRETLFALITGIVSGSAPPKAMLAVLREHWIAGINAHELRFDHGHVVAELRSDAANFDLIASMIAYRMVEHVLTCRQIDCICHGPNCSWIFIDSSKAGRRRWCDMGVCGTTPSRVASTLAYVSAASDLSEVRKPPFFEAGMRPAFPRRPQRQPSVQKRGATRW